MVYGWLYFEYFLGVKKTRIRRGKVDDKKGRGRKRKQLGGKRVVSYSEEILLSQVRRCKELTCVLLPHSLIMSVIFSSVYSCSLKEKKKTCVCV